jgi:hypothetical protein
MPRLEESCRLELRKGVITSALFRAYMFSIFLSDCEHPPPLPPPPLVSLVPEASSSLTVPSLLPPPYLAAPPLALPLSCVCQNGNTALIEASFKGRTAIAKLLVDAKANTDLQNKVTLKV